MHPLTLLALLASVISNFLHSAKTNHFSAELLKCIISQEKVQLPNFVYTLKIATPLKTNSIFLFQAKTYQTKKSVIVNLTRTPTTRSDPSEFSNEGSHHSNNSESRRQISTYHVNASDHPYSIKDEPNILQVYAAYETGLASGTSVKLTVTKDTTAREVIDLVIKQLNMAVILKGREGPVYENDKLKNFCLVAVIGSRERCLRDDFRPLNLQNPWKSGKLFVRMKHDVLAALERIQSSSRLKVENMSMSSSVPNMASATSTSSTTASSTSRPTTTVL